MYLNGKSNDLDTRLYPSRLEHHDAFNKICDLEASKLLLTFGSTCRYMANQGKRKGSRELKCPFQRTVSKFENSPRII